MAPPPTSKKAPAKRALCSKTGYSSTDATPTANRHAPEMGVQALVIIEGAREILRQSDIRRAKEG